MKDKWRLVTLWLWLLSLSVLATIYLAWLYYPAEVDVLQITKSALMTKDAILYNFKGLMDYLTNPLTKKLVFASFRSSKEGLAHFQDVKLLFHFCQFVAVGLAYPSLRFLKVAIKDPKIKFHQNFYRLAAFLPIVIALFAVMIGFDNFFILFHQLLFPGKSNWSFNPSTDPVIWILPETFFMHCFLVFFSIYECVFGGLYLLARRRNKR
ncbi:TIGR01906 family membrane protein [Streptococcus hongkongensis]|nr:membrane protein [Streptococcus uberis]